MTTLEKYLIGAVVLLISSGAAAGWWALHNHKEQAIGAQACIQNTTVTKETAVADNVKTEADYQTNQAKPAEAQHVQDIAAIDLRVIHTPVLVHDGAICASPVPGAAGNANADNSVASKGGTVGGTGSVDIRPALEAFKAKLETIVADDRREDADWPKPAKP